MAEKKSFKDAIVEGAARIGADASELVPVHKEHFSSDRAAT
jgi:hypothetical protein